jgi:ABC-type phosphate transport system permease subunit
MLRKAGRIPLAIMVGIVTLIVGFLAGSFIGAVPMWANPKFDAQHRTPGDGILIMLYGLVALMLSIPLAISLAEKTFRYLKKKVAIDACHFNDVIPSGGRSTPRGTCFFRQC